MRAKLVRLGLVAALAFAACFASMRPAWAACTNDVDCPAATCGGQVCQWPAHACVAAGTDPQASDGWCTTDTDCKCMGEGATCAGVHCSFTLPKDAGFVADASSAVDASSAEPEASAPEDAGPNTFVDAGISSGADSGVPPVGPDAGPMGSTVSRGCAIGAEGGVGVSGWSLALAPVALLVGRRRRRARV